MVNRRTKRKNAMVAVTGGALETVQGRGISRRSVVGVGPSPFVMTGPTTVREQLTAMRGASNSGSSRLFSGQFNLSNKCNPATSSVAQTNRLNRCYFSRGAINNCEMSGNPLMSHKLNNANSISVPVPVPVPSYSFVNESHNQQQFNGASCVIMKPAAVKPQAQPTHKVQPVDRILMPRVPFALEECEADKEVALINSSNLSNMTLATNVNMKHNSFKKKKMTRMSPRVSKVPCRKTRQSPRFILSPADSSSSKNCEIKNATNGSILLNSMNPVLKVEPNRSCLDILLERQKRLQKIVITLKRKPRPFTNLRRAIEKARKVKGGGNSHVQQENNPLKEEVKCSTPKNDASIDSSNEKVKFALPTTLNAVEAKLFTETEKAVKSIGHSMSPIAPVTNLDPEDSFEDLIPEEFMVDESEILGISLDNISAFGDSYADLDFDEETRSSFPEISDNVAHLSENERNLGTFPTSECGENKEYFGSNGSLLEPSETQFFQPQIGAIKSSSQKLGQCFGSTIGALSPPLVLSNNLDNDSKQVAIDGVNVFLSEMTSNEIGWPTPSYAVDRKKECIDMLMAPTSSSAAATGNTNVALPPFTSAITLDVKQDHKSYVDHLFPRNSKEPKPPKNRSGVPLRNLMSALSPIQSMSCSTASARIDSPLLLTASPSEELSPLS